MKFETLERREVFDAALQSVFDFGSDEGSTAASAIVSDEAGNRYVGGRFTGTVDFDRASVRADGSDILTSLGVEDGYVAKYNSADQLLWVRGMGSTDLAVPANTDAVNSLKLDAFGNVFAVGSFRSTGTFGSIQLTSAGGSDAFVAKLSPAGDFLWANRWGSSLHETGRGLDVDSSGNVITVGERMLAGTDVLKWNASGNLQWMRSVNDRHSFSGDVRVDKSGNIYVASNFAGTVDFDPSTRSYARSSGSASTASYLLKLNSSGNFSSVTTFPHSGSGFSYASSLEIDASGSLFVCGYLSGTADFDPTSRVQQLTGDAAYIAKLDARGKLVWVKGLQKSGGGTVSINDSQSNGAGGLYIVGSFGSNLSVDADNPTTVDFNPGKAVEIRTSQGQTDAYLLELTSAGELSFVHTISGPGDEVIRSLTVATDGSVSVAGSYMGEVDFSNDPLIDGTRSNSGTFRTGYVAHYLKA
jgi:hypothetical protein